MKALIPYKLSKAENEALKREINKQIAEQDEKYQNYYDAMVLYTLYESFGFGKKRLRMFYDKLIEKHKELQQQYEMNQVAWICLKKLKDIGVDIEEWNKEN